MKIVVIIPSLNEENNISNIARIVDRGLSKYYPNSKSVIVNADSNSEDDTVKKYLHTPTHFPKKSIVDRGRLRGKGSNIRKAVSRYKTYADYFLMLDADVVSVREDWVKRFLEPLITTKAHMVTPIYTRNRYGGNTTNHFSSPIIYACLNKYVVQPIAGDFSFTKKLASDIYRDILYPSDYKYGIDTVITWTAILKGHKITQIKIGKKLHSPSFPKIVPMFGQVADTTFRLINENKNKIAENLNNAISDIKGYKTIDKKHIQVPSKKRRQKVKRLAINRIKEYPPPDFINKELYKDNSLSTKEWVEVLAKYLSCLLNNNLKTSRIEYLAKSITSLYLFRVLGYFREINKLSAKKIEKILIKEKNFLKQNLLKELGISRNR